MRSAIHFALGAALAASLAFGNSAACAQGKKPAGAAYQVVRLQYPGSAQRTTWALELNDRGNAVGDYEDVDGNSYGYHYDFAANDFRSLGLGTKAHGVNQFNEIVGTDEIWNVGLYWGSPGAEPIPLFPLAGHTHSRAVALNNAGVIIGSSYIPEDPPVTPGFRAAVAWRVDSEGGVSGPVELPFLVGDIEGDANDLTEAASGVTIVTGTSGDLDSLPVSWSISVGGDGLIVTEPVMFIGAYTAAVPWSINNAGDAVGRAGFAPGGAGMPFLRRAGQAVLRLPLLSNAYSGSAAGINDAGRIVGGQGVTLPRSTLGGATRAVLWTSPTTVVDLNSLVSLEKSESLTWSLRINNRGDILAFINGNTPCLLIAR